jgi:hypothetical protein
LDIPDYSNIQAEINQQLSRFVTDLEQLKNLTGLAAKQVITQIQSRMTASAGHIRELSDARRALAKAVECYKQIQDRGFRTENTNDIITAIQAEHLALTSITYLKAIVELLEQGSGSRGSHLVLAEDGVEIHIGVINRATGKSLRFKLENKALRDLILRIKYDQQAPDMFTRENVPVRQAPADRKVFEPAWRDFREGKIYKG